MTSNHAEVAIPAQGALGLAPQTAKGVEQTTASEFRWFMWTSVGFGATQVMDNLPPAIAASILPRGLFKTMLFGAGDVAFVPSLEQDIYFLLRLLHGKDSVATQTGVKMGPVFGDRALVSETGVNVHTFVPDVIRTRIPWATVARKLPNADVSNELEEITRDCKAAALVLNVPGLGIMTAQMSILGIEPRWAAPSFSPGYDREIFAAVNESSCFLVLPEYKKSYTTTGAGDGGGTTVVCSALSTPYPHDDYINGATIVLTGGDYAGERRTISDYASSTGTITVATAFSGQVATSVTFDIIPSLPAVGATITLDNGVIRPNAPEMQVIGKAVPHDLPLTGVRGASVRLAVLVDSDLNYDIVTLIFRNATGAGAWSMTPFQSDVHLRVVSPFMVTGSIPYALEFMSIDGNGSAQMVDNLPLVPGRSLIATVDMMFQEISDPPLEYSGVATGTPTTTTIDVGDTLVVNAYKSMYLRFKDDTTTSGLRGECRRIASNTTSQFTVATAFSQAPAAGDTFEVYKWPYRVEASAGAAGSVTLEAGDLDSLADEYVGFTVKAVAGTSAGQVRMCSTNDASDVFSVSENWDTNPVSGDEITIIPFPWAIRLQNGQGAEAWPS